MAKDKERKKQGRDERKEAGSKPLYVDYSPINYSLNRETSFVFALYEKKIIANGEILELCVEFYLFLRPRPGTRQIGL